MKPANGPPRREAGADMEEVVAMEAAAVVEAAVDGAGADMEVVVDTVAAVEEEATAAVAVGEIGADEVVTEAGTGTNLC